MNNKISKTERIISFLSVETNTDLLLQKVLIKHMRVTDVDFNILIKLQKKFNIHWPESEIIDLLIVTFFGEKLNSFKKLEPFLKNKNPTLSRLSLEILDKIKIQLSFSELKKAVEYLPIHSEAKVTILNNSSSIDKLRWILSKIPIQTTDYNGLVIDCLIREKLLSPKIKDRQKEFERQRKILVQIRNYLLSFVGYEWQTSEGISKVEAKTKKWEYFLHQEILLTIFPSELEIYYKKQIDAFKKELNKK